MPARLLVRDDERVVERSPEDLSELRDRPCWLDVASPTPEDLDLIARELGLHPLAIEDAKERHQRPKIEQYEGHYFIVFYSAEGTGADLHLQELSIFVAKNALVTVRDADFAAREIVERRWREGRLTSTGMLLHALLDAIVDGYFPVADTLGDEVEELEGTIVAGLEGRDFQRSLRALFQVKRRLLVFRQRVAPERDVLAVLTRGDLGFFDREQVVYFQDVYDHIIRVTDEIDTFRELASNVIDAHLAAASNRLNEVMRVLTAVATILLVVSVITGFWGMNFEALPFESVALLWATIASIVVATVGLLVYFRRHGWL